MYVAMGSTLHQYKQVSGDRIESLQAFSPSQEEINNFRGKIKTAPRVFLATSTLFPIGTFVSFQFEVNSTPYIYTGRGLVKLACDGTNKKFPSGLGIQLFEVTSRENSTSEDIKPDLADPTPQNTTETNSETSDLESKGETDPTSDQPVEADSPKDKVPLPTAADIEELFTGLLGVTIEVQESEIEDPETCIRAIGTYILDNGEVAALIGSDLNLAALAGGALSLIPADMIKEDIAKGELSEEISENFYEVLNIASSMFNLGGVGHIKLKDYFNGEKPIPDFIVNCYTDHIDRLDLSVDIEGYGQGKIILVTGDLSNS